MKNCLLMIMSICALLFSLSHEKIRQKHQLILKLSLFMWFWPEHAQIRSHIPQNLRNLQNLILIVFYIYPAFQHAIDHLLTIYGSKVMNKSLEVVSLRVCPQSNMAAKYSEMVYYRPTRKPQNCANPTLVYWAWLLKS